jgi:outer membrane protein OmpA-like peptidoglycan-associated protein/ABC-type amino acid transport substrate-binding protein
LAPGIDLFEIEEAEQLMRKVVVMLSILSIVAMIAWKVTQPVREQKARRAELLLTSDAANLDRVVRIWGDDWLGYLIFRSRRFQTEMQRYRLGVRYDLVFDFKERFRGLENGSCDFVAATIDSYLSDGEESGFPGVITWVIDESYGADAIIGGPNVKSIDALNQTKLKGALVGFSPSEFLLKAQVANFRMNALLPRVAGFRVDKEEDAYAALAKGNVDFAVLWEPFVSQALKEINGATRLLDSSQTKGIIVDVAIGSRKALAGDPALGEKVARAYFDTLNYYLDHADEFRELASADSKKDAATAGAMLDGIKFVPFSENCSSWFGLDAKSPEEGVVDAINRIARILGEVGDVKDDPFNGNPFSIVNSKPLRTLNEAPAELLANEVKMPGPTPLPGGAAFFRRLSDEEWKRAAAKTVGTLVDEPIIFGSGSSGVPEDFEPTLRDALYRLAHYPKYRVIVSGYVSPGDDPQADQQLSEERALTIKRYLVEQGGVQEDRIFAQGLGSTDLPTKLPDESDAAWKRRARRAKIYLAQEP